MSYLVVVNLLYAGLLGEWVWILVPVARPWMFVASALFVVWKVIRLIRAKVVLAAGTMIVLNRCGRIASMRPT